MIESTDYEVGQRVCITGIGFDNLVHVHAVVDRITKTLIITKTRSGTERRYRRGSAVVRSMPYSPYGGTQLHPRCARPRKGGE